jgi:hypothetical protein
VRPSIQKREVECLLDVGTVVDDPDAGVEVGPAFEHVAVELEAFGEDGRDRIEFGAHELDLARFRRAGDLARRGVRVCERVAQPCSIAASARPNRSRRCSSVLREVIRTTSG